MTGISTLGQALDQIARLQTQQRQLEDLTIQMNTGKKTQKFTGLGTDVLTSKRARADIKSLDTYIGNITNAERRMNLMQNAIEEFQAQAGNIANSLIIAVQEGDYPDLEGIQDLADNIYDYMLELVNTKDGDRYLFSGADSSSKPLTDTGLLTSFLGEFVPDESDLTNPPLVASGVIGQWGDGTLTTDQFIQSYRNVTETTIGYSSSLVNDTAGEVFVRVDDNSELDYTVLADTPGMKDIMVALSVLRELPPPEYAPGALNDPAATTFPDDTPPFPPAEKQDNFFAVINDLAQMINGGIDSLDQERFGLAQTQARIQQIEQSHTREKNTLKDVIGDVEDADVTETAAKINSLQVQLEASYAVTSLVSQLSLVRFLN